MFKWFKFGVAGVTGFLIIIGVVIGIGATIIFNLYVEKQKNINEAISSSIPKNSEHKPIKSTASTDKKKDFIQHGILNKGNFDQLKKGMTYIKVVDILGSEGKKESVRESTDSLSVTYQFKEKGYEGIDMGISFFNGELSHKTFYSGEPEKSEVIITSEQFDKIPTGMTYDDAQAIIGGPGILISEYGFPEDNYHTQTYRYDGHSESANAFLVFKKDILESKSQSSLE
ncbi:hypothetical protein [Sporosarcina sp. FA9]|uniref:hypothetical protein n=1 Tax=Sporosarcina sp. FA9 TaxID=3413030 RepID=UPI003F65BE13